jgi:hypothetical protein
MMISEKEHGARSSYLTKSGFFFLDHDQTCSCARITVPRNQIASDPEINKCT